MKVKVHPNQILELPNASTPKEVAEKLHLTAPNQAVTVAINGQLRDFNYPLKEGDEVQFWNFEDPKGQEVFWHTSAHVLAQAILRLWPNAQPTIGPPIENGFYYDFGNLTLSDQDFEKIEAEVEKILAENHKTQRIEFANKQEAREAFVKNTYKCELIDSFDEKGGFSAYRQGEFFDLCRGPHMAALNKIKAFKVLKTSGAYWRGDSSRAMLTRVYAISFPDRKQLKEYLHLLEEAKKRDHKVLGQALDLFSFKEEAPGMPFIHPRGLTVWNRLIEFIRTLKTPDYVEIKTPSIMSKELWERSGHWFHYRENMFLSEVENRQFAIKPMNCPGCMLYYRSAVHSYRELPLRVAEIGHVHRFEASGALNGLFRVRGFHQDDAHLFMRPDQIREEIRRVLELGNQLYMTFGLSYRLELSTRPEKSKTIGTDEDWQIATDGLKGALDDWGHPYRVNEGDGAFYGPKIDIHIRDALGRHWQCGTVQLDMFLPQRFELEYVDSDGGHKRPVMLHVALFGSIERFFGILVEHFAGKFPLWLSPYQVKILAVADRHVPYAQEIQKKIQKQGILCDIDDSHESVGKKVRNAQLLKANYMLTIGDQEVQNQTVSLRTRDNVVHGEVDISDFLAKVVKEREERALMSPYSVT
ncbi:MAG: threonine--tRNA ligase [Chlamydiia bacterium]|nr:threonine--tRNA ligase [Chlamydiia bacterium]